ncbi:thiol reductant ABC exporter subunit CydC [Rhodoluna sp.]|uniref:thiol reductant ABC exporter subunit CydC n=1 Tax=Rhodoluna sp. TaxID=1969481 RepID=UPI0025F45FD1|nr:thiol reductant ABC exporter subunit CydC [Rhodoluna sp.]
MSKVVTARYLMGLPKTSQFKIGLFVAVLQAIFSVALLATSAWLISRAAEQPPIMYLSIAVVGVRGFAVGRSAGRYAERILLHDSAFKMLKLERPRILEKLIPFAPAGMPDRGATISRLVNDVDELQNLPIRVIAPVVQSMVVSILAVFGVMLLLPSAALVLLSTLLASFFLAFPLSAWASARADSTSAKTKSELVSLSIDTLERLEVLQTYGWLPQRLEEIKSTDHRLAAQANRTAVAAGIGQSLVSALSGISVFGMAYFGAKSVDSGHNPGVTLAVFALLPLAVYEIVQAAQPAISAFNRYRAAAKSLSRFIDHQIPVELDVPEGELTLDKIQSIELRGVTANYPGGPSVLRGFNIKLARGEKLLLHGNSGTGKSTIANILVKFLAPSAGEYLINGKPASIFSSDSVRKLIGLIEQNPVIFIGSVRDNLVLANNEAQDSELVKVLVKVGLWQMFVQREGLDTQLGERGVFISGGEAQRLAVARALLANFEVLIMDEPTANVDRATAAPLVKELLEAGSGKTILLITHDSELGSLTNRSLHL